MKNITLLMTLTFILFYQGTRAQVTMEMKAGPAISNWRGEGLNTFNSLVGISGNFISRKPYTGFFAGGAVNIPVSDNITIQPGLQYSQTGTVLKGELGLKMLELLNITAKASMVQQSIEIPLLVKARIGKGFEIIAGPQASYQLNSKLNLKATALVFNLVNKSFDMSERFEPLNVSAMGGFQYQLSNGLGIQAMYVHSLSSILKDRTAKVYSESGRIGLTYRF